MGKESPCLPTPSDLSKANELLKALIRIDTSNPPGNEVAAFDLLQKDLEAHGLKPEIAGSCSERPNLVACLEAKPENRTAPPLVMSCHLDVVQAPNPDEWEHPPFSGAEADGCIWGRGAIDMKGFAVMAITAMKLLKQSKLPLNRDVILTAVCDEEAGAELGSQWLVENRPDLLREPEYVLNEVGGFTVHRKGRRFYPVQVAEKGVAWLRMTATSPPGHSSMPAPDNCLSILGNAVHKISRTTLPWHVTPAAKTFLQGFSQFEPAPAKAISNLLFNSVAGKTIVGLIPNPRQRASVEAILRNTATPTRIKAGSSINSLPHRASVDLDGRLIPGQTADQLIQELQKIVGDQLTFEVIRESQGVVFPTDTPLYSAIEETLGEMDSEGVVIPSMIPGFTDSHNYAKLGATCYGFYPLKLEEDLDFAAMFHGDNERIPIEGFHWGIETLMKLLTRFLIK